MSRVRLEVGKGQRLQVLGPISVADPVPGFVIPAAIWSVVLLAGLIHPPIRFLSCIAAFLWPLAALPIWVLVIT